MQKSPINIRAIRVSAFRVIFANRRQYCIPKCNPLILFTFWGGESPGPDIKGVDTHANGSKEEDEEEGEARRQEEDDEAPEEEISDAYRVRSLTGANRYGHSSFGVTDGEGKRPRPHPELLQAGEPRPSPQGQKQRFPEIDCSYLFPLVGGRNLRSKFRVRGQSVQSKSREVAPHLKNLLRCAPRFCRASHKETCA